MRSSTAYETNCLPAQWSEPPVAKLPAGQHSEREHACVETVTGGLSFRAQRLDGIDG